MPYTSDIPLEGSPLAASYKEAVNGMRYDISALNRYLPLLEQLSSTYPQGGGGSGAKAVMATILQAIPSDDFGVGTPPYLFTEYSPPDVPIENPVTGFCWNVMEIGLKCDNELTDFIPPGLNFGCLEDVFPGSGGPEYTCERIANGTVVLLHDTQRVADPNTGSKLWAFSCPVPMCVGCPEGG